VDQQGKENETEEKCFHGATATLEHELWECANGM
jgi:hypothetical protein